MSNHAALRPRKQKPPRCPLCGGRETMMKEGYGPVCRDCGNPR